MTNSNQISDASKDVGNTQAMPPASPAMPAPVSKHIYLEAITDSNQMFGPMAVRLTATSELIAKIRKMHAGIASIGLESGVSKHSAALFVDDEHLIMDELVVTREGEFSFGGVLDGIRTETHEQLIDDLEVALLSANAVEVMTPQSGKSKVEFIEEMLDCEAAATSDIESLDALIAILQEPSQAPVPS